MTPFDEALARFRFGGDGKPRERSAAEVACFHYGYAEALAAVIRGAKADDLLTEVVHSSAAHAAAITIELAR